MNQKRNQLRKKLPLSARRRRLLAPGRASWLAKQGIAAIRRYFTSEVNQLQKVNVEEISAPTREQRTAQMMGTLSGPTMVGGKRLTVGMLADAIDRVCKSASASAGADADPDADAGGGAATAKAKGGSGGSEGQPGENEAVGRLRGHQPCAAPFGLSAQVRDRTDANARQPNRGQPRGRQCEQSAGC